MSDPVPVEIQWLPHGVGLELPSYATAGSACFDLQAAVPEDAPVPVFPGRRVLIPLGFRVAVPPGWQMEIRPRSGHALKCGVLIPNSPGTIDEDYRGEVQVIVLNTDLYDCFYVTRGMRIAQGLLTPVRRVAWVARDRLQDTARGPGGFGSTGG